MTGNRARYSTLLLTELDILSEKTLFRLSHWMSAVPLTRQLQREIHGPSSLDLPYRP